MTQAPPASPGEKACGMATTWSTSPAPTGDTAETARSGSIGRAWRRERRRSVKAPGTVELFIEPDDADLLKSADNLTLSPWGDLVLCEDRSTEVVRLIGVTPEGRCYILANNRLRTEFAGAVFTPDGSTLLVNIQQKGLTVAITGPWTRA